MQGKSRVKLIQDKWLISIFERAAVTRSRKAKTKVSTDQSQHEKTTEWTNQKSEQMHVAGAMRWKMHESKSRLALFLTSKWLRKWHEIGRWN